jgi:ribonuclease Y
MQSHHEEYPVEVPEAYIVNTADILSAGRPGARRETLEYYLKRMEDLEKIAYSFEGVEKAYAIQAGREIRIFVVPERIDDFGALRLARDIAKKVEAELKYPGEIKVNVIRETRAVEYAR